MIGNQYLKNIEISIFESETQKRPEMKEYYYYWERRVYNALIKMVIRGILTYMNLL
jgi:dynein heavy chain, axonemal